MLFARKGKHFTPELHILSPESCFAFLSFFFFYLAERVEQGTVHTLGKCSITNLYLSPCYSHCALLWHGGITQVNNQNHKDIFERPMSGILPNCLPQSCYFRWNHACTMGRHHRNYTTNIRQWMCFLYNQRVCQVCMCNTEKPICYITLFLPKLIVFSLSFDVFS